MTLPISFVRPAQESLAPAPGPDVTHDPASPARTFGHALSSALHEPAKRDEMASRRARIDRGASARDQSARDASTRDASTRDVSARDGSSRDANSREPSSHGASAQTATGRDASGRDASGRDASGRDASDRDARNVEREAPRDDRSVDGARDGGRSSLGREPGTTFVGTPGARAGATASMHASLTKESLGTEPGREQEGTTSNSSDDAANLGAAFVAHTLESAVAALPPLSVMAGGQAQATGEPTQSPEGDPSAATASTPLLTLSVDRAVDEATRAARRLALEGAAARDPLAVRRDTGALAPELRARLDRVVDRMEQEYGYTVEVVETTRSQERQDALYAQGRTAPGDVVTWTRNSKHLTGTAADVVIDGGYSNPAGFERLARVAREEGLRTLWPRDPGHIELAGAAPQGASESTRSDSSPRLVRGRDGDIHILPVGVDEAITPSIPKGTRSGIDPSAARGVRGVFPGGENGVHIMPTAPTDGTAHILPFPAPELSRTASDASGRAMLGRGAAASQFGAPATPSAATAAELTSTATGARSSAHAAGVAGVSTVAAVPGVAGVANVAGVASVASVASVAPVATVATVATVARVATVGASTGGAARTEATAPHDESPVPATEAPNAAPHTHLAPSAIIAGDGDARRGAGNDRRGSSERGERERADGVAVVTPGATDDESARALLGRDGATTERTERASSTSPVAGLSRSDATERIARVLRIQEAAGDRPMSSVLLRLDAPDGGEDRIRIDLRGQSVGATLDIADPQVAAELRSRAPELQQALQRQGLEGESMVVRTSSRSTDASVLTASAIATERDVARAASATASDGGGSTARDSRNPPRAFERDGTDQQRSRQRRDGKGDRR